MKTITFETYPDMIIDLKTGAENENYDNEQREFTVPKTWAAKWIYITYRMSIDEFMDEYTWDDTYEMYMSAEKENVIISCTIEQRAF